MEKTGEDWDCNKQQLSEAAKDLDCADSKSAVTDISDDEKECSSSQGADIVEIAPDVRKRLETKWEKILGPKYKIIVSKSLIEL